VHQQNVIHRDIKPSNLIRRHSDYKIVLIDFGAVKQIGTQTVMASGMAPFTIAIGTPGYLPTEQASGMPKFNSDIYAVGMIGISALTGLSPTRQELSEDAETGEIRWTHLVEVSQELVNVIDKMVRYDFRDRYQSVQSVLNDLRNIQSSTDLTVPLTIKDSSVAVEATTSLNQPINPTRSQLHTEDVEQPKLAVRRLSLKPAVLIILAGVGGLFGLSKLFTSPNIVSKSPVPPSTSVIAPTGTSQNSLALDVLNKADQLRESQKPEEALTLYEQALKIDPKLKTARWGQCYGLNVLQRYEEALKACDQALSLDPNYTEALSSKGYALNALKRYKEALTSYEQAIKNKPDYFEAWVNKGAALYNMQRYDEALTAYDKVLNFKPDYSEAWNNKGTALAASNNYRAAIEAYDKALKIKQDYPEAWNNRGVALEKMERNQEALASYEKAIQLKPDYSAAKENRQRVLQTLKR
jgi:tetratricopeptide (TPR) repeat protein